MKSITSLRLLALLTIIAFPAIGFAFAYYINDMSVYEVLQFDKAIIDNIIYGCLIGMMGGMIARLIINQSFMRPVLRKYSSIFGNVKLSWFDIVFVSICAGFGEEIFFRGAVQYQLGIWITAIIFVAIHGYLNPYDWRVSVYGAVMTVIIAGLGYATNHIGLLSACIAHTVIDILLFARLARPSDKSATNHFASIDDEQEMC